LISSGGVLNDIIIDRIDCNGFLDTIEEMPKRLKIDVFASVMFYLPILSASQLSSFPTVMSQIPI
jgi:hypothetical protein